jgi:hypothetical protein
MERTLMTLRLITLSWLLVGGCYSYEEYLIDQSDATCGWYERCDLLGTLGYDSYQECVDEAAAWNEADPEECVDYDGGAAKDCVRAWLELPCGVSPSEYPPECGDICAM